MVSILIHFYRCPLCDTVFPYGECDFPVMHCIKVPRTNPLSKYQACREEGWVEIPDEELVALWRKALAEKKLRKPDGLTEMYKFITRVQEYVKKKKAHGNQKQSNCTGAPD